MRTSEQRAKENEILAQLQAKRAKPKSYLQVAAEAPATQAILGIGDAANNLVRDVYSTLVAKPLTGESLPHIQHGDPNNPYYMGGEIATNVAAVGAGGMGAAALATKGLTSLGKSAPKLQKYTGALTGAMPATTKSGKVATEAGRIGGRLIEAGGMTALMSPENTAENVESALKWQAGFEAVPIIGKPLAAGARYIPGSEYAADVTKWLKDSINKTDTDTSALFEQAKEAAGDAKLGYVGLLEKDIEPSMPYFDTKLKRVYERFLNNSNYQNAFELQSQMGDRARSFRGDDFDSQKAREQLLDSRNLVLNDIKGLLLSENPEAAKILDRAQFKYATEMLPYLRDPKFDEIAEGLRGPRGGKNVPEDIGIAGEPSMQFLQQLMLKQVLAKNSQNMRATPSTHPMIPKLSELNERIASSNRTKANPVYWPALVAQKYGIDLLSLASDPKMRERLGIAEEVWKAATPKMTAIGHRQNNEPLTIEIRKRAEQ